MYSDVDAGNTKKKLFTKIAVFLMYREIYCPSICDHQRAYIAYWRLYCVQKWSNIDSNSMLQGSALVKLIWVEHMVWFSQSQWLCLKLHNNVLYSVTLSVCVAYSLSLCVCMVVPRHHIWMIKTNNVWRWCPSSTPSTCWLSFLQTLNEYEIITLIYNRNSCRLDLIYIWTPEDIIIKAILPGCTKFEGKYF